MAAGVAMSWTAFALDLASNDRRYLSIGSMAKVDEREGGETPQELLAQIA